MSHANPLTPVTTSEPPTLFTITNVSIIIQGNNASTLGTHSNHCVHNYAFCSHLSLNFKTRTKDSCKGFSLKSLEIFPLIQDGWQVVNINYKYLNRYGSCITYLSCSDAYGFTDNEIFFQQVKDTGNTPILKLSTMCCCISSLATQNCVHFASMTLANLEEQFMFLSKSDMPKFVVG